MLRSWQDRQGLAQLLTYGLIGDDLPRRVQMPTGDRILVLAPHQDDELIGAGGTLLLCAQRGAAFRMIYFTDGATHAAGAEPHEVARWRKHEASMVWQRLAGVQPVFWDYPNRAGLLPDDAAARLRAAIDDFQPTTIFLPNPFEQPTDHRHMNDLLAQADQLRPLPREIEVWGYQITTRLPGNAVVDITSVTEKKFRLNRLWHSQNLYLDYAHWAKGRDMANAYYLKGRRYVRRAAAHAELFITFPVADYLRLVVRSPALDDGAAAPPPDFFIIGLQKSGTYWLTALLDAHPEIRCFPSRPGRRDGAGEAHFFDLLARMDRDYVRFRKSLGAKLGKQVIAALPEEPPESPDARATVVSLLREQFNAYCQDQRVLARKYFVGEKTTETVFHPDLVEQLYPGVRKICVLRDPRDRIVSFFFHQKRKGRLPEDATITDAFVLEYVARVRRDYEGLLQMAAPLHVLTYEALTADTPGEVTRLLTFLGVDTDPAVVKRVVAAASFEVLSGREPGNEVVASHFRNGRPGNHEKYLSPANASRVVAMLEDLTVRLEQRFWLNLSSYRACEPARI